VTQPSRAEVHTNPHAILFVREQINVVIAAADGTELVTRHLLERRNSLQLPGHKMPVRIRSAAPTVLHAVG
jgi:hypothetical protein